PPRSPRRASSCPTRGYRWSRPPRRSHICRAGIWGWWHRPLVVAMAFFPPSSNAQTIGFGCGSAEQRGLLVGRATGGDALEGVPHHRIAAHTLVDREIALEHRALR